MAFLNLNKRFASAASFAAWLATLPPPAWKPVGSTFHNTLSPNESQWRGAESMLSMQRFYEGKGWDRGPHCYLALGTAFDGIWIMTPPTVPGIHAGDCNSKRFGIEVVGDFQARPMSTAQLDLLTDTIAALHRWARIGPDVNAHRDCMADRTCPGAAAYAQKPELQRLLSNALAPSAWISAWQAKGVPAPPPTQHGWAIPQLYQRNYSRLGACLRPEQYSVGAAASSAVFERGELIFLAANAACAMVLRDG